jgi:hypothetical protein
MSKNILKITTILCSLSLIPGISSGYGEAEAVYRTNNSPRMATEEVRDETVPYTDRAVDEEVDLTGQVRQPVKINLDTKPIKKDPIDSRHTATDTIKYN